MRVNPRLLQLTATGLVAILLYEGYKEYAHIPVPGDVPTIGFGTTEGVKLGDKITPEKAVVRALLDVNKFEGALKECVKVPLYQHEYDVYVSVSYNIGSRAFCNSTMVKLLNQQMYPEACAQLKRWVYSGGVRYQGLVNRREQEYRQCMGY
jgi:lysozyme